MESEPRRPWFVAVATGSVVTVVVDAALVGVHDARALLFAAGVAAPWAVAAGLLAAGAARGRASWPAPTSQAPLSAARVAAVLAAVALSALPVTLGAAEIVAAVRTPRFAALAVLGLAGVGLVVAALLTLALTPLAVRAFARLSARAPALARPGLVIAGASIVVCAAALALLAASPAWMDLAFAPLAASLAGLATATAIVRARRALGRRGPLASRVAGAVLALLALSEALGGAQRASFTRRRTLAGFALALADRVGDPDRDGASALFGGGDCAPFDARRGPFTPEVAGNGVDEDCSGIDADPTRLALERASGRRWETLAHRPATRRPNVVLITTDALTFGHTGHGGYARPVTPELDAFAADAVSFTRAYSTSSSTGNAIPALHTGRLALGLEGLLPPHHQAREGGPSSPGIADLARAHGYRSLLLPGALMFDGERWPGLAGRFDEVDTAGLEAAQKGPSGKVYGAPELTRRALAALARAREERQPLFLWVHYFDHHPLYGVPPSGAPWGTASEVDRYDAELAWADRHWGELFRGLAALLPPEEYVLIFTADHGEAFDADHPGGHHDQGLGEGELHVPLLIKTGGAAPRRVDGLVSHLDVSATLEDWLGAASSVSDGESLLPVLFDQGEPQKSYVPSVLWQPRGAPLGAPPLRMFALRSGPWMFLSDRERAVSAMYRIEEDPLGHEDLSRREPEIAEWGRWAIAQEIRRLGR